MSVALRMASPPLYYVFLQHSVAIGRRFELKATLDHCHAASLVYQRPLSKGEQNRFQKKIKARLQFTTRF